MSDAVEDAEDAPVDPGAHEAVRLRGPRRLLLLGPIAALVLAFVAGGLGADGRAGLVLLLLLLAIVFGVAGVWIGVGLLVDEFRGAPTSRRRGLLVGVMFVATLVCMTAVSGVAQAVVP